MFYVQFKTEISMGPLVMQSLCTMQQSHDQNHMSETALLPN